MCIFYVFFLPFLTIFGCFFPFCPFFEHFHYTAGRFYFKDTNSRNGSWVNGQKVEAGQERVLSNGDIIKLADDMVDCGDMQKIFAKILLPLTHMRRTLSSRLPLNQLSLGSTKQDHGMTSCSCWSQTRPRPTTSQPALTRFTLPNRRQKSLA